MCKDLRRCDFYLNIIMFVWTTKTMSKPNAPRQDYKDPLKQHTYVDPLRRPLQNVMRTQPTNTTMAVSILIESQTTINVVVVKHHHH